MSILDMIKRIDLNLIDDIGYLLSRNQRRPQRPAPQMTMGVGALGRRPPLEVPTLDMDITPRSNRSNILQGIDMWNGVPFIPRPPVQMPRYYPPGTILEGGNFRLPRIDPDINIRRGKLPLYIERF